MTLLTAMAEIYDHTNTFKFELKTWGQRSWYFAIWDSRTTFDNVGVKVNEIFRDTIFFRNGLFSKIYGLKIKKKRFSVSSFLST